MRTPRTTRSESKKVAISQSNYIPWKGYFDLIASVDEFILYDDVQYTKRDWRNRNLIKTPKGLTWLTIPVMVRGKFSQKINETVVSDCAWTKSHWNMILQHYKKAAYFDETSTNLGDLYNSTLPSNLSEINMIFIERICNLLGIDTVLKRSSDFELFGDKSERLANICEQTRATTYVSGPAAKSYLDFEPFNSQSIEVEWFSYKGYPEYNQLWGEFNHGVSVIDLLFNCGNTSKDFIKKTLHKRDTPLMG